MLSRKTLELLLISYNNISNGLKPCAEKQKFEKKNLDKYNHIFSDYFYKNDGLAGKRLWGFIKNLESEKNE